MSSFTKMFSDLRKQPLDAEMTIGQTINNWVECYGVDKVLEALDQYVINLEKNRERQFSTALDRAA